MEIYCRGKDQNCNFQLYITSGMQATLSVEARWIKICRWSPLHNSYLERVDEDTWVCLSVFRGLGDRSGLFQGPLSGYIHSWRRRIDTPTRPLLYLVLLSRHEQPPVRTALLQVNENRYQSKVSAPRIGSWMIVKIFNPSVPVVGFMNGLLFKHNGSSGWFLVWIFTFETVVRN